MFLPIDKMIFLIIFGRQLFMVLDTNTRENNHFDIREKTILQLQSAMELGTISSQEIVQTYLDRIQTYDAQGPSLKSILKVHPDALEIAERLDRERKFKGARGLLHGIPVILKDNFNTLDMRTTSGTFALENSIPLEDAFLVKKLRQAGAVIFAKANLHELAQGGTTLSSLGGQTCNPYDMTRTPGGSSGGTAAAVAANLATVGLGTDTINSIRSPASANSLVGLRPTMGFISRDGIIPCALTQDMPGPITRSVADAAILLDTLRGYDNNDPITAWSINQAPQNFRNSLNKNSFNKTRLGILQNLIGSNQEHLEVKAVMNNAVEELRALGAKVIPVSIPNLEIDTLVHELDLQLYEVKVHLNDYLSKLKPSFRVRSLAELLAFGKLNNEIEKKLKDAQNILDPLKQPEYKERLLKRLKLQQTMIKLMADHAIDALIYPHQKQLVSLIGEPQLGRNGFISAITGFPAITVPAGFSKTSKDAPIGIPIGIEFMGRPWSDYKLLEFAYSFEQSTKHRKAPVSTP